MEIEISTYTNLLIRLAVMAILIFWRKGRWFAKCTTVIDPHEIFAEKRFDRVLCTKESLLGI